MLIRHFRRGQPSFCVTFQECDIPFRQVHTQSPGTDVPAPRAALALSASRFEIRPGGEGRVQAPADSHEALLGGIRGHAIDETHFFKVITQIQCRDRLELRVIRRPRPREVARDFDGECKVRVFAPVESQEEASSIALWRELRRRT